MRASSSARVPSVTLLWDFCRNRFTKPVLLSPQVRSPAADGASKSSRSGAAPFIERSTIPQSGTIDPLSREAAVKSALVVFALIFAAAAALAQAHTAAADSFAGLYPASGFQSRPMPAPSQPAFTPFSRFSFGAGVSPLGVNLQAATTVNHRMNARITGNLLHLNINDISSNGFDGDGHLALASAGATLDIYPFPKHGLRVSPGVLFYNTNALSGAFTARPGTEFTLNGVSYTSSTADPVTGTGAVNLHKRTPAFTLTSGWGNMIPRDGSRFSFPLEIGVAFTGAPDVALDLTSGQACVAEGANCVDVTTDPELQTNLAAQIAKYRRNLDPLKTYPVFSFGVAYSFAPRTTHAN